MAVFEEGFGPSDGASRTGLLVNYAGAALSLALILGVGFWGYKLIMRDVSGIPVVRAMEGDMRVLPDNPGGAVAVHTGLAVNEVAAVGEAGGPEDRLVLAPSTPGLAEEDLIVQPTAEAGEPRPTPAMTELPALLSGNELVEAEAAAVTADDIIALADQIAAEQASAEGQDAFEIVPASVPGVALSLRPIIRPAALRVPAAASTDEVAVTATAFPAGTNLVQLGAFPTPTLAATEWTRLQGRFGQLMGDKDRVIQVSNQTSGTWYRLRASGFADRAEARRFCAALQAEDAICIAVMVN